VLPTGKTEPAAITLADEDRSMLTVTIHPVTGALQISDRAAEDTPLESVPDRLRILLQPLAGLMAEPAPAGGGKP
jgi:hypothetical protein